MFYETRAATPLSHAVHVNKDEMCANVRENTRCEGVLFTHFLLNANVLCASVNESHLPMKSRSQYQAREPRPTGQPQRIVINVLICT